MISTFALCKQRALHLLDDPSGGIFTDVIFTEAFGESWDNLNDVLQQNQCPLREKIVEYTLPANTTSLAPATAGITGLGELLELEERLSGSSDKYSRVWEKDKLDQFAAGEFLTQFVWRLDQFQFLGATTARQLRITYFDMPTAPVSGETLSIDGALTYLAKSSAALMAPRKGYMDLADRYKLEAVGPKFDEGIIGGALYRLIQPEVRARQRVPVAPRPYSIIRRRFRRVAPMVAAQLPVSGSAVAPAIFSTTQGTITGAINGVNDTFFLSYPVSSVVVHKNGMTLTPATDYAFNGTNQIVFAAAQIPKAGPPADSIMVEGWV